MATTTTSSTKSTIIVNASGQAADGVSPHFRLLIDGKSAGEATVSSSTKAYTFTADLASNQDHKIQVVYDNDDVNSQSRDLLVKSVVVNGKTMQPTEATYERHDDGATGDKTAGGEGMWWNGALTFSTPASLYGGTAQTPATAAPAAPAAPAQGAGASTITVNAQGTAADGVNAHFNVLVDGKKIGDATVTTEAKDFSFKAALTEGDAHKVQIQYDNDAVIDGQDRNLKINAVEIDGKDVKPSDDIVSYDRGALDGKDVIDGQSDMKWTGTLVVDPNADKSGTDSPAAPATPVTKPAPTAPTAEKPAAAAPIAEGYLHTEGNQIVDSSGQNVKLTGVNWFGAEGFAFAPQGLWMDSYQNHMDKMKELGFNTIRLPFSDAMLDNGRMPTGIDYSKNPDLRGKTSLEVFDKIIEYADKSGMKIMLDHHRSGDGASANENGLWYTDQYPESKMIENWKMLAERYADNPSVVAADLHNEPHGQATWGDGNQATDWAAAAERIGNAIQSVNPNWLLVVEGVEIHEGNWYWWGGNLEGAKERPIEFNVDNKLVYSVHDYGPSLHMMDWFKDPNFPNNMPEKWNQMWGHLIQDDKAPVLVGEFGSKMETDIDKKWMPELIQYMDGDYNLDGKSDLAAGEQGVNWTYWAWSPGSGDTGGIMKDDWTVDNAKMNAIKPALFEGEIA
ncbi:carbohydrate-binding domain-containing protein [Azospirillum sp. SYSU D00513]|uniref:cellulase family glycosylhydrolase n=1 Tax=Azospirillum sp. SYSU D00513 TaxID=2812561 RepID=UPI001A979702|nr:carbohydrate-binding domain-containing protein [Azospirillum sp. SYSU D00513]